MGLYAQSERTTGFGGIVSAEAEAGLGGPFGLSVEEELRFDHNFTRFDRWLNSVGVDYTCLHNRMNIGLTADYIRRHNDRDYYENRGRLGVQVTYTEDYRRFKFQVRSKAIGTFFDERTGHHRVRTLCPSVGSVGHEDVNLVFLLSEVGSIGGIASDLDGA